LENTVHTVEGLFTFTQIHAVNVDQQIMCIALRFLFASYRQFVVKQFVTLHAQHYTNNGDTNHMVPQTCLYLLLP